MADSTVSRADFLAQLKAKMGEPDAAQAGEKEPKATQEKERPNVVKAGTARLDTPEGLSEAVAALLAEARKGNKATPTQKAKQPSTPCTPVAPSSGKGKRVAAYIRVSSDRKQEDSYEVQERYFTQLLRSDPSCVSAGIYSDYGVSATSDRKRTGFKRLLRHCGEGKIDRVVCKSISRFARNTEDFLKAMQQLKESGVTIAFEKEGLDTAEEASEFVLTLLAALAQQESRSISENLLWGKQKRYQKGDVRNYAIYGYRFAEGEDAYETTESGYRFRKVEIVEEEAETVRFIFEKAAEGMSGVKIAQELNRRNIPAPVACNKRHGKGSIREDIDEGWTGRRVRGVLRRERYCGDAMIQKTYIEDVLTHKTVVNKGEKPQYYIKDHHPAIISRELFEAAQSPSSTPRKRVRTPFSCKILCAHCGRFYHVRNRDHNPIWFCPSSMLNNGKAVCRAEKVYEEQVIRAVRKGVAERYRLFDCGEAMDVEDILQGLPDDGHLMTRQADGFLSEIRMALLRLQDEDSSEAERALQRKQLAALKQELAAAQNLVRVAESKLYAQNLRAEVMGEAAGGTLTLEAAIESARQRAGTLASEVQAAEEELKEKEEYWKELEENCGWRRQALEWLDTLPEGREGTAAFLNGLTDAYAKAFILDITVFSPRQFTIRWFDNTRTDVEMFSNVEDHRHTASYYDGSRMREKKKPARRRG